MTDNRKAFGGTHAAIVNRFAWMWRAYVWPGRRLNFDGTPVVLPPSVPDGDWIDSDVPPVLVPAPAE